MSKASWWTSSPEARQWSSSLLQRGGQAERRCSKRAWKINVGFTILCTIALRDPIHQTCCSMSHAIPRGIPGTFGLLTLWPHHSVRSCTVIVGWWRKWCVGDQLATCVCVFGHRGVWWTYDEKNSSIDEVIMYLTLVCMVFRMCVYVNEICS